MLLKENQKNKEMVGEIVNSIIGMNSRKHTQSHESFGLEMSRKKSAIENLFPVESAHLPDSFDIRRMS